MKIYLEVEVSEASTIAYALGELANKRRERGLERRNPHFVDSANGLDTLADHIRATAYSQQPH